MSLGNRLQLLRNEQKLERDELAKALNISYSALSKYETNQRFPSQELLVFMADYFNVSVDYLLGRTDIRNIKDNNNFSTEEVSLIDDYKKLNSNGKKEAEKRVKELTFIPFYVEEEVVSLAAHNDHLDDPDEKDKIIEDFNDMDKW